MGECGPTEGRLSNDARRRLSSILLLRMHNFDRFKLTFIRANQGEVVLENIERQINSLLLSPLTVCDIVN